MPSPEAAETDEPLGMLGIDEIQHVKASKRTARHWKKIYEGRSLEFHLSIELSVTMMGTSVLTHTAVSMPRCLPSLSRLYT